MESNSKSYTKENKAQDIAKKKKNMAIKAAKIEFEQLEYKQELAKKFARIKAYKYDINFKKKMKDKIDTFIMSERRASVEQARSINKIMSARCQVNTSKAGPTSNELLN